MERNLKFILDLQQIKKKTRGVLAKRKEKKENVEDETGHIISDISDNVSDELEF